MEQIKTNKSAQVTKSLKSLVNNYRYTPKLNGLMAAEMLLQIGLASAQAFTQAMNQFGSYPRKETDPERYDKFRDAMITYRLRTLQLPAGTYVPYLDKNPRSAVNQTISEIHQSGDITKAQNILPKLTEIYLQRPAEFDKLAKPLGYVEVQ